MKTKFWIILLFPAIVFSETGNNTETTFQTHFEMTCALDVNTSSDDSIPPDSTNMRNITSIVLSREMIPGWNLGNSLEAIGSETAWGNPLVTQTLIDSVKAAGFKAVRIPVSWSRFSVDSAFTIQTSWLERVEEVVNYVLSSGMYALINEHWDGGWIQPTNADKEGVTKRFTVMWKQIAVHFRDYSDSLLFAGTNEVHVENDWGTPKREYLDVQNGYNQIFVNTVRATGGRNYYRHLVVQGFRTNIDLTVKYMVIPEDVIPNRLVVEVHYYDPYNFSLNQNSNITQWGKYATDPSKTESWANESYADNEFNRMKTTFIDKGYAVILGEYGAISRKNLGSEALNEEHADYRKYYVSYLTGSMTTRSIIPFYWDNGYTGNHGFGIFNRYTGAVVDSNILEAIMEGSDTTFVIIEKNGYRVYPDNIRLEQNCPNPFNPSTEIRYQVAEMSPVRLCVYNMLGEEIQTLVDEVKQEGKYSVVWYPDYPATGIYFVRLHSQKLIQTRKMLLVK